MTQVETLNQKISNKNLRTSLRPTKTEGPRLNPNNYCKAVVVEIFFSKSNFVLSAEPWVYRGVLGKTMF